MSRYTVNRILRDVYFDAAELVRYQADRVGYVRGWQQDRRRPLTGDEATAVAAADYASLYAMGAHPYLIWGFCEIVLVPGMSRVDLVAAYRAALLPLGYPDVSTTPEPLDSAR